MAAEMNPQMLTGYGQPTRNTKGVKGQRYKDLNTGDIYVCELDNEYSPVHHYPIGGYIWTLRVDGNGDDVVSDGSTVKSVNGMTPDENGDVAVQAGGLTVINLTYDEASDTFTSDLTRNQIKALVAEGKQCVFYDGARYSSFIDVFGNATIRSNSIGNTVGDSVYYYMVSVGATNTKVSLKPIVNTPYILADNLVYKLAIGTDGTVTATRVTDGSVIGT